MIALVNDDDDEWSRKPLQTNWKTIFFIFAGSKENAMIQSAYLKQTCDVMWRLPSKLHKEVVKGHYDDGR